MPGSRKEVVNAREEVLSFSSMFSRNISLVMKMDANGGGPDSYRYG